MWCSCLVLLTLCRITCCRLVHRLDMAASGVLALARTPDAASWLSVAFAQPAAQLASLQTPDKGLGPCLTHAGDAALWHWLMQSAAAVPAPINQALTWHQHAPLKTSGPSLGDALQIAARLMATHGSSSTDGADKRQHTSWSGAASAPSLWLGHIPKVPDPTMRP